MKIIRKIVAVMIFAVLMLSNVSFAVGDYSITVKVDEKFGEVTGKMSLWKISDEKISDNEKQSEIEKLDKLKVEQLNEKYKNAVVKEFAKNAVVFDKLDSGAYFVKDISGIKRDKEIASVIVNVPDDVTDNNNVTINAKESSTNVRLIKVDENGNTLMGAKFKLLVRRGNEYVEIKNKDSHKSDDGAVSGDDGLYISNEFGEIIVNDIKKGDYIFREVEAPTGYLIKNVDTKFTVTDKSVELRVVNSRTTTEKGRHDFMKTDESNRPLGGAVFKVMTKDKDGKFCPVKKDGRDYIVTSGSNGKFAVENMDFGKYFLIEIKAPVGYVLLSEPVEFEIKKQADDNSISVIFIKNKKDSTITRRKIPGDKIIRRKIPKTGDIGYFMLMVAGLVLFIIGRRIVAYDDKLRVDYTK
ncbi:collagen binding domain-containing protein [uncultured Finegoldia sp.]|uniref:MSCRAMM family protein n=1 Tax=uncultured Finegoldia sp. TaxID=328009 RepID=UPI00261221E9|nr:SpaA isopeptide-forming pilin-related protein [uncultured Finegoldia sp.]